MMVKIVALTYTLMPSLCFEAYFRITYLLSAIYSFFIGYSGLIYSRVFSGFFSQKVCVKGLYFCGM